VEDQRESGMVFQDSGPQTGEAPLPTPMHEQRDRGHPAEETPGLDESAAGMSRLRSATALAIGLIQGGQELSARAGRPHRPVMQLARRRP
jgi:hypothetical protein